VKSRSIALLACALDLSLFGVRGYSVSPSSQEEITLPSGTRSGVSDLDSDLLRRAEFVNDQFHNGLCSFVCDETVVRSHSALDGSNLRSLDIVTARVHFENGSEQYSEVRSNNKRRASLSAINGAWSEGEFGTLLHQTQELLKSQRITVVESTEFNGVSAVMYQFDVAESESPWTLVVAHKPYRIPFRTIVVIDRSSGQILQVNRTSTWVPSEVHISCLEWGVRLGLVSVSGNDWLLPVSGDYSVLYAAENRRESNWLSFSNYRRYGAEVALRFDAVERLRSSTVPSRH
jgi:hypothetical protein